MKNSIQEIQGYVVEHKSKLYVALTLPAWSADGEVSLEDIYSSNTNCVNQRETESILIPFAKFQKDPNSLQPASVGSYVTVSYSGGMNSSIVKVW